LAGRFTIHKRNAEGKKEQAGYEFSTHSFELAASDAIVLIFDILLHRPIAS
jgi:hypothetical protein